MNFYFINKTVFVPKNILTYILKFTDDSIIYHLRVINKYFNKLSKELVKDIDFFTLILKCDNIDLLNLYAKKLLCNRDLKLLKLECCKYNV